MFRFHHHTPLSPATEHGRRWLLLAWFVLAPAIAEADGFEGTWRNTTEQRHQNVDGSATTLTFRQFGSTVCGEWAEGVDSGKILGGNITGRAQGRRMNANVGEDIYWQPKRSFPHQQFDTALFMLQGRKLIWYTRNKRAQLEKIQTFERVDDGATLVGGRDFTDPQFARLCPAGIDFTSLHRKSQF